MEQTFSKIQPETNAQARIDMILFGLHSAKRVLRR